MSVHILFVSSELDFRPFYSICCFWLLRIHLTHYWSRLNYWNFIILLRLLSCLFLLGPSDACLVLYHVYYLVWTYLLHSLHRINRSSTLLHTLVKLLCKKFHLHRVFLQSIRLVLVALHEPFKLVHLHTLILLLFFHLQKPWPYDFVHYPQPKYLWRRLALLLCWFKHFILGFGHTIEMKKIIN